MLRLFFSVLIVLAFAASASARESFVRLEGVIKPLPSTEEVEHLSSNCAALGDRRQRCESDAASLEVAYDNLIQRAKMSALAGIVGDPDAAKYAQQAEAQYAKTDKQLSRLKRMYNIR